MKRKTPYVIAATVSLLFLIFISAVTAALIFSVKQNSNPPQHTDVVYVYVEQDETDTETVVNDSWFVKEYNEKIGIFDKNGELVQIIDTYTKTLPKADRAELQEGFWIEGKSELYSIIEAYTD